MKIEEAMVYLLATSQHGLKTEQIARELELRGLVPYAPRNRLKISHLRHLRINLRIKLAEFMRNFFYYPPLYFDCFLPSTTSKQEVPSGKFCRWKRYVGWPSMAFFAADKAASPSG